MFIDTWMLLTFVFVVFAALLHLQSKAYMSGKVAGMYEVMDNLSKNKIIDFDDEGNVIKPKPVAV